MSSPAPAQAPPSMPPAATTGQPPEASLARQLRAVRFGDWFLIFFRALPALLCAYLVLALAVMAVAVVFAVVFGLGVAAVFSMLPASASVL